MCPAPQAMFPVFPSIKHASLWCRMNGDGFFLFKTSEFLKIDPQKIFLRRFQKYFRILTCFSDVGSTPSILHWISIGKIPFLRHCIGFFLETFFKSTQNYFLWIDFQKSGRFEKEKSSPFILHHKLACFIDGNTGNIAWAWGSISFFLFPR